MWDHEFTLINWIGSGALGDTLSKGKRLSLQNQESAWSALGGRQHGRHYRGIHICKQHYIAANSYSKML
jgi:hypothetical protein